MKSLSKQAFEKAALFIEKQGRPLEKARFQHEFHGAPVDHVLECLASFQNNDGGFGHAFEPDLRAPESSALCTSVALQTLTAIEIPNGHPMLENALEYLWNTLDRTLLSWRIIPPAAENSPRAPWWYQEGREESFEIFSLNPTAEILGYLRSHPEYTGEPVIQTLTDKVVSEIESFETIEMHDLLCCLRLLKTKSLPQPTHAKVQEKLSQLIHAAICLDPSGWESYSLRPLQVIDTPDSPFAPSLETALQHNLDYEIATQNDNGAWLPTWSWDNQYTQEWQQTKQEWSSFITLDKLLVLKRFNRMAGL